jgi:LuxR family transcriptional regulator, maltose regulon positive regulatory protein
MESWTHAGLGVMAGGGTGAAGPLRPGPSPSIVRRQRLIALLHQLVHHRLLMVVAPAGYGKTTLLDDFAADCTAGDLPISVCRYVANAWDADGMGLVAGITAALRAEYPAVGSRTLTLLEQARLGGSEEAVQVVTSAVAGLVADVEAHVRDYALLVVDDYHLLDESATARGVIESLLERLPEHVHLVLLSRSVPAIDTTALIEQGQVAALNVRELAFTAEELALFLRRRYEVEPDPGLVAEVQRWTEGWIAGLILAAPPALAGFSGLQGSPSRRVQALVATLSGARRASMALHEYLAAELLRQQGREDRELLLAAALPEVCDAAQLDEVLGGTDSGAALERLQGAGVPLVALPPGPAGGGRFRLHALLRQYLKSHIERSDPARALALSRRWSEVAEAHAAPAEALDHAVAARWWEQVVRLLESHAEEWIAQGRRQRVAGALDALPSGVLEKRPGLRLYGARLALVEGRPTVAIERARQVFFAARQRRDSRTEAKALLLEAIATMSARRFEEAFQLCLQALEHRTVRRDKRLLAEAYRYLATVQTVRGAPQAALEHYERSLTLYERFGSRWDVAAVLNNLGTVLRQVGDRENAERRHLRALALREEMGDIIGIGKSQNNLALLFMCGGALHRAEQLLTSSIAIAESAGQPALAAPWRISLGDLRRAQQRAREALDCYQQARERAGASVDPRVTSWALLGEAAAYLVLEDWKAAETTARTVLERSSGAPLLEIDGQARISAAVAALRMGRRREAAVLLDAAREDARQTRNYELQARAYLWSGQVAYEQKRWGEAIACVQVAAEAAAALGGPTPLALEGRVMAPLLKFAAGRDIAPQVVAPALELLDHDAAGQVRDASAPRVVPLLPEVRLDVLGAFSAAVSGREVTAGVPAGSRTRELLVYLAMHPSGRRREEIAADLWPDAEAGQDVTLVYTTVHRLRQALFPEIVACDTVWGAEYAIDPAVPLRVDALAFGAQLEAAADPAIDDTERIARLEAAVALYAGPFFRECYSDWAERRRRQLEHRYVGALAELAELEWNARRFRRCLEWCGRLLEVEPGDDAVHSRILDCYAELGEALAGILHYRRYAQDLAAGSGAASMAAPEAHAHRGSTPLPLRLPSRRLAQAYQRLLSAYEGSV